MPGSDYEKVVELAADQHGYLTTSQARERSLSDDALRKMAVRGTLERVSGTTETVLLVRSSGGARGLAISRARR